MKNDKKANEINTRINMFDKALDQLKENKIKQKLKLKQKSNQNNRFKEYNETENSPIMNENKNLKYLNTNPSNSTNVKNQILNNKKRINKLNLNDIDNNKNLNKNNIYYLKSDIQNYSNKNIINPYTEEEKNIAISVFSEEEINIIMKLINNKRDRYNNLIEKLIVLERFRNTKKSN